MAARNKSKGEDARRKISQSVLKALQEVRFRHLSSLGNVSIFRHLLLEKGRPVDLLMNKSGIMVLSYRELSANGFELQFVTNFLDLFTLTKRLLPILLKSKNPRVMTITSSAAMMGKTEFDDLQCEQS